jgi:Sulfotransferase domain
MRKPNFFIVGAPKCGTTALAHYLSEHPNVFMCSVKEPHYFADDFPKHRYVKDEAAYLRMFSAASEKHLRVGEASALYLLSQVAIKNIKAFDPHAKLIVMLRNPLDMVYSFHSQALYDRDEQVSDFTKAWSLIEMRKNGQAIPGSCRDTKVLCYNEIGKFGEQLERLLAQFPRDQVMVIFYEDFSSKTSSVYSAVLDFLDLPNDGRSTFPIINGHKQNRSAAIAQFTQKTPADLARAAMKLKKALHIKKWGVLDLLRAANRIDKPRKPLERHLRQELADCYRDDVSKVAAIMGRDLNIWLN